MRCIISVWKWILSFPQTWQTVFLIVISDTDLRKAWNYCKMINIGQSKSALFPEDFLITMSDRVSSRRINIDAGNKYQLNTVTSNQRDIWSIYIRFNGYFSDLVIFFVLTNMFDRILTVLWYKNYRHGIH